MSKQDERALPVTGKEVASLRGTDWTVLLASPYALEHAFRLVYGADTERPDGHEGCILCDVWFGPV